MKFLDPKLVETVIAAQGNRAVTVEFAKKNGEINARNGLPKVYKRRVGGEAGERQAKVLNANGLMFFDYPKPRENSRGKMDAGFSFKKDRVISIKAGGAVIASAR